jgi:hypothetical protein
MPATTKPGCWLAGCCQAAAGVLPMLHKALQFPLSAECQLLQVSRRDGPPKWGAVVGQAVRHTPHARPHPMQDRHTSCCRPHQNSLYSQLSSALHTLAQDRLPTSCHVRRTSTHGTNTHAICARTQEKAAAAVTGTRCCHKPYATHTLPQLAGPQKVVTLTAYN